MTRNKKKSKIIIAKKDNVGYKKNKFLLKTK